MLCLSATYKWPLTKSYKQGLRKASKSKECGEFYEDNMFRRDGTENWTRLSQATKSAML